MSGKKRFALVPQYMKKFACIGAQCEDSCCVGWRVHIDEVTFKKYNRIRDLELKAIHEKHVIRVRSNRSERNYAKIKLYPNGSCPFLSAEKMCKIQQKLGEDYLSDICATYPRVVNVINGVLERSATVSCPEAARLVLLNPDRMEFDVIEESTKIRNIIAKTIDTHAKTVQNKAEKYFWELRIFTIQILQNRSYVLWERLILLGMFFRKLEEYIESGRIDEIPQLIATYTQIINEGSLKANLANIPVQYVIQMQLVKELVDYRFFQGINNSRYMECFVEMLQGIQYKEGLTVEEIAEHYKEALERYYLPFMSEHEYILENYLVNFVFKNVFPFGTYASVFEEYAMLVIHFAMIKLHLIGMAGFHKGLNTDQIIKLIQSFAKVVEHNQQYLLNIHRLLTKNGYMNMPYMAILIKN